MSYVPLLDPADMCPNVWARSMSRPFSLFENLNEDAVGSQPSQNTQNRAEIGCEYISLDPAQVTAFDMGGSCKLDFCSSLAETH